MDNKDQFTQRLIAAVAAAGLSWNGLADRLSEYGPRVYAGTTTPWRDGAIPSGEMMLRLPKALGVDGHWLLTGEGSMLPIDQGEAEQKIQQMREILEMPREAFKPLPRPDDDAAGAGGA